MIRMPTSGWIVFFIRFQIDGICGILPNWISLLLKPRHGFNIEELKVTIFASCLENQLNEVLGVLGYTTGEYE